jgi:hypothetical protein
MARQRTEGEPVKANSSSINKIRAERLIAASFEKTVQTVNGSR